ncbi:hypothetical protein [Planobispora rosea]|uniref:hypothetical protein n=1 Tax=Planobispora rosea TaxID=35762 RepID=UPI00083ADBF5|nr:hypothetical protein [Planobispora rosea]
MRLLRSARRLCGVYTRDDQVEIARVRSAGGVDVHADAVACVTTETYTRRPPVETRGWHHVVEVGYRSPGGEIVLSDPMGGSTLPDPALRGRGGDYRIRVHHAWLPRARSGC